MNEKQKQQIKEVLDDLKAENIISFNMQDENGNSVGESEEIIIATARSVAHMRATANNVKIEAKRLGINVIGYEGLNTEWAIVDMAFVVVHIMTQGAREFYKLDKLFNGEELAENSD